MQTTPSDKRAKSNRRKKIMSAKVLLLGICAANRDLLLEWASAGLLPNYASAMQRGLTGLVDSMPGFYVGTTWPSFATCVSPAKHSRHYILQLEPGTYQYRREPKGHGIRRPPFWQALSRAGRKVALFDIPHAALTDGFDGVQVVEWGAHDGDFGEMKTSPPSLRGQINSMFGPHPAPRGCDGRKKPDEVAKFRDQLVAGAALRADITLHHLIGQRWDLFAQVWTESHCVGHQCWHFHDSSHPLHRPEITALVGDPVRDVYVAIDAAIGRVLATVDSGTTVILFTGHGMGAKYDSQFFLDDILLRLGYAAAPHTETADEYMKSASRHRRLDRLLTRAWQALPSAIKHSTQPLRTSLRGWVEERRPPPLPRIDAATSLCFPVPNNAVHGGVRINVVDREPQGAVKRGAEYDAVCERLSADLADIVNVDTGEPIVNRIFRTDSMYSGDCLDFLPDLLIEWNQKSRVRSIASSKIGRIQADDPYTRTGDHRKGGVFVAFGPHIVPGKLAQPVQVTDFGPTIARLLEVPLPDTEGVPIAEIAP